MNEYSTKNVDKQLVEEIVMALKNIRGWGSVEIIVQDYKVVQITERNIKKTQSIGVSISVPKSGS
jgi:hypothetical protein